MGIGRGFEILRVRERRSCGRRFPKRGLVREELLSRSVRQSYFPCIAVGTDSNRMAEHDIVRRFAPEERVGGELDASRKLVILSVALHVNRSKMKWVVSQDIGIPQKLSAHFAGKK